MMEAIILAGGFGSRLKDVEIIENPYILKNSVKPRIKKNTALAGLISLFAGIFLGFFME